MKCPKCNLDNPDDSKFCKECGTNITSAEDAQPSITKTLETPKEELTTGSSFAGRYQIIEELGKGGMGKVYTALDTRINEKIAIKFIKPEIASDKKTLDRFGNELKLARKIAHKNVGKMFDINEEKDTHYITMEYVSGQDLKGLIRQTGQLAIGTTISIAKQICEGLSEAHKVGVVHRDLKPNNIMIDREGQVRIMDFGIARSLKEKGITGAGVIIGTPEYMSPEQAEAMEVDHRSDIYSLGVILYEMVTGRVPFEGDSALSIAMKHKGESPMDPRKFNPQITEDLNKLVLKCLEKEKGKRFQSADDLHSELSNIEKSIPTSDREIPKRMASTSKEITVSFQAKRLIIPALAVISLIIVGVFLWHPWSAKTSERIPSELPAIAVLPFEDLSPNKDQEPFCDGLADALTKSLSKLNNLRVRGKTSSSFFRGSEENNQVIGEKLAVRFLLRGSLQKVEKSIRVFASLVDVSDDTVLWSDNYDGELGDTFAFQDKIAMSVVNELKIQLLAGEEAALAEHPTESIEALQSYQLGRYFRYKLPRTGDMMLQARDYFKQVIEIDPTFSAAYAQLAESLMMLQGIGWLPWADWEENERTLRDYVQHALDLDPFSSEAHSTRGVLLEVFDNDWEGAEKAFQRAIELNPNDFGARWEYALLLMRTNRLEKAEEECLKALEIEPLSTAALSTLEEIYGLMGSADRATEVRERRHGINPPVTEERDYVELQEERIRRFGRNPQFLYYLGNHYARSGNVEEAEKKIEELRSLHDSHRLRGVAYMIARIYNNLGRKEMTLQWLEEAAENQDQWLMDTLTVTWMESVRSDPRFRKVLERFGFGKYLSP